MLIPRFNSIDLSDGRGRQYSRSFEVVCLVIREHLYEYLGIGTRQQHSYNGRLIRNCLFFIE